MLTNLYNIENGETGSHVCMDVCMYTYYYQYRNGLYFPGTASCAAGKNTLKENTEYLNNMAKNNILLV